MQDGVGAGYRRLQARQKRCPFLLSENKEQKIKKTTVQSHDGHMERDGVFLGCRWQGFSAVLTTVM